MRFCGPKVRFGRAWSNAFHTVKSCINSDLHNIQRMRLRNELTLNGGILNAGYWLGKVLPVCRYVFNLPTERKARGVPVLRQGQGKLPRPLFPPELFRLVIVCSLLLFLAQKIDASRNGYKAVFLGELSESGATTAHALNNYGQVVGESGAVDGTGVSAFTRKPSGTIQALEGLPGGNYSQAFGVNDHGLIVGSSDSTSTLRAVVWTLQGKSEEIGALPGDVASQAMGVNNRGQVVGYSTGANGVHAFVWTKQGGMQRLPGLKTSDYTQALGINDLGDVVGVSGAHAALWIRDEAAVDLGTLPGDMSSFADAINNHDQVVGVSTKSHRTHGFFWSKSTGMRDIGVLPGGNDDSVALGINDAGQVVGQAGDGEGDRGILWTVDQGLQDLNAFLSSDSDVHVVCAFAINNHGQIAAFGGPASVHVHHFNAPRAYLLNPSDVRISGNGHDEMTMPKNQDSDGAHAGHAQAGADRVSSTESHSTEF
jgi:probable HAF family extracellular repeat protein